MDTLICKAIKIFVFYITIPWFLYSCNKNGENKTCFKDKKDCSLGITYQYVYPKFSLPCFNPINTNEFICIQENSSSKDLIKFNISTCKKTTIISNFYSVGQFDWNKNGQIVYASTNWNIYLIENGSETPLNLTHGVNDQNPKFNADGDKIIYERVFNYSIDALQRSPDLYKKYRMLIIDTRGNVLDSTCVEGDGTCGNWGISNWDNRNYILHPWNENDAVTIKFYDYNTKNDVPTSLHEISDLEDLEWFNDSKVVYSTYHGGIFMGDIHSGTITTFKKSCDDEIYDYFSVSGDKTKILYEKEVLVSENDCDKTYKKQLYISDISGKNEKLVEIPN